MSIYPELQVLKPQFAAEREQVAKSGLLRSQVYYAGAWRTASSGEFIEVTDPYTGAVVGRTPSIGAAETQAAIDAAEAAFAPWAAEPARVRSRILRRWFELVEQRKEDLARLITLENGKPLKEARAEVEYGAGFIEFYAEEASRIYGQTIPSPVAGRRLVAEREPIGVCAAITPWNFPLAMLTRKIAPALAAGCTIICKPASQTPLTALALAVLAEEAGVPPGVISVVTGKPAVIAGVLTGSSVVRKISFTGSTQVGARLMAACAPTIKRLSLELGGNAPLLVFDDADLDIAIEMASIAKFRNSGQSCIAANRIYVQRGIHDAFVDAFARQVGTLNLGDGFDPATDVGPLIDQPSVDKVDEHLADAISGGGEIMVGGPSQAPGQARPTLVRDVRRDALLTREETFGPLAAVIAFDTTDEAIAMANDTPFGLAAYFCSSNPQTIARVARRIESGMVGINTGLISTAVAPFGGVKQSGLGREGSRHGLDEYLNIKYLCQAGL
jgi:succinate-semialdehyde dehydrogenase/glutarate-semialdehyde dehydrogenase